MAALADLERRGTFGERGYRSSAAALGDLLGCERFEAHRRRLPPPNRSGTADRARRRDAAAAAARHRRRVRHKAGRVCGTSRSITRLLNSAAAGRLSTRSCGPARRRSSPRWAGPLHPARVARAGARQLVEALDQPTGLSLTTALAGSGQRAVPVAAARRVAGRSKGRFDDAAMFDAIATVIDAHAAPRTADDDRAPAANARPRRWPTRAAGCSTTPTPPPVIVRRATSACERADPAGGSGDAARAGGVPGLRRHGLTRQSLRMLGLRRRGGAGGAWTARASRWTSGGPPAPSPTACAGRSPSATAVAPGAGARRRGAKCTTSCPGSTAGRPHSANLVMLCRVCHRLVHHAGWDVRLVGGSVRSSCHRRGSTRCAAPAADHPRSPSRRRSTASTTSVRSSQAE